MTSDRRLAVAAVLIAALLLPLLARPAEAQFDLGGQRSGTSSGTFLKIGVGARAVGMGEAFVAVANDPTTIYWNPAGLGSLLRNEVEISHVSWPAQIHYEHMTWVIPSRSSGARSRSSSECSRRRSTRRPRCSRSAPAATSPTATW